MPGEPSLKYLTADYQNIPKTQNELLQKLGQPHVDSFNFFLKNGLQMLIKSIDPVEFALGLARISVRIKDLTLDVPKIPPGCLGRKNQNMYPTECRQGGMSYTGILHGKFELTVNDDNPHIYERNLGDLPIMVKSDACHLHGLSPKELVAVNEHEQEWGGYFISKGLQRILRMLILTRRNYPLGVKRNVWRGRGAGFSEYGIMLHSVRPDETAANNILHYVNDGTAKLMFILRKSIFFAPVALIMKCLMDVSDEFMFEQMMAGHEDNLFYRGCVINMLRSVHECGVHSYLDARKYLGKMFAVRLTSELPPWATEQDVCEHILKTAVCIHLDTPEEKFHFLVFMVQKLMNLAQGKCAPDGADSLMMHEVLMGGHLYLKVLKAKIKNFMTMFKVTAAKFYETKRFPLQSNGFDIVFRRMSPIGKAMQLLIATGTLPANSGLAVGQETGLSVVLENLNRMRYIAHFRAVHRGAFFQSMRTTEARILLPEAWGFLCPVHTPDGAPCGLLNHLARDCEIAPFANPEIVEKIPDVLLSNGVIALTTPRVGNEIFKKSLIVMLDGRIIGYAPENILTRLVAKLRYFKVEGKRIPPTTEIVLVTSTSSKLYPGLFLFTTPARMMRPVLNLGLNKIELIGTFEQVFMDICIKAEEAYPGRTTHMELSKTAFLSNLANLIPMPDCNQSPRNMYQCQMGKQTMGNPCHNWLQQADGKLYRLLTPTSPLFRTKHYDDLLMDDFAMGTNAIVAVISYTGYDMEDAMIMNKASIDRGLAAGCVFKSEFIEISEGSYFGLDPFGKDFSQKLDLDGLVSPGALLQNKDPFCSYYDAQESKFRVETYKGQEPIWILSVRRVGTYDAKSVSKVHISYLVSRNPSVGDKFASRAGQKGILSHKWPCEDLPFTESGLVPDIVFNPHGFPSRMTIAMLIEVMAGKSAAIHGFVHDATPFRFNEENTAIDYFGRLLEAAGYNYYGTERMYSGVDGREMTASIFFGVVHYQRLRHMVSDKWQVRSTGPIDIVTHQPIKGRRRGGGIRFGEMERDSLLSHGASFLLLDRLFHCSDKSKVTSLTVTNQTAVRLSLYPEPNCKKPHTDWSALMASPPYHKRKSAAVAVLSACGIVYCKQSACRKCGNLLSPYRATGKRSDGVQGAWKCRLCEDGGDVVPLNLPYIFKYLVAQLASVNIHMKLQIDDA